MRDVDRLTIERGIPGLILMENAAQAWWSFMAGELGPLSGQRIVVICGKGNNGGDGLAMARQLLFAISILQRCDVVLLADPAELQGDAAANLRMLAACGCAFRRRLPPEMRLATVVVDALLGTGVTAGATGACSTRSTRSTTSFALAKIVSIDLPSGMPSDSGFPVGEAVRADYTVTFTALKVSHALRRTATRWES